MRKGDSAKLEIDKVLCADAVSDERRHICQVIKYDEEEECIFLCLQSSELTDILPDMIYGCEIQGEDERIRCTGRVIERYNGEFGKTLKFRINNGFYKINIKSLTNK